MESEKAGEEIKVSVIMPVYNAASYLDSALQSVLNQTLQEFELICIDDASDDGSLAVLRKYAALDKRLRLTTLTERISVGAARNLALDQVRGEYIAFLDADDWLEQEALKTAYEQAHALGTDVTVYRCDQYLEQEKEFISARYSVKNELLPKEEPFSGAQIEQNLFQAFLSWSWDKLFRADFIREQNLRFLDLRSDEDTCFVLPAILLAERISTISRVLIHHRRCDSSLSATRADSPDCWYTALLTLRQFLIERDLFKRREQDFINYCLHYALRVLNSLSGESWFWLYERLTRGGWLRGLGLADQDSSYFYDVSEFEDWKALESMQPVDYLFRELNRTRDGLRLHRGKVYELRRSRRSWKKKFTAQQEENSRLAASLNEAGQTGRKLREELQRTEREKKSLDETCRKLTDSNQQLQQIIDRMQKSLSWRIGRRITWLPRKISELKKRRKTR